MATVSVSGGAVVDNVLCVVTTHGGGVGIVSVENCGSVTGLCLCGSLIQHLIHHPAGMNKNLIVQGTKFNSGIIDHSA